MRPMNIRAYCEIPANFRTTDILLHVVDSDTKRKAHISFQFKGDFRAIYIYDDVSELLSHDPSDGVILLHVDDFGAGWCRGASDIGASARLLPLIGYSEQPPTQVVVNVLRMGGSGFVEFPFGPHLLEEVIRASIEHQIVNKASIRYELINSKLSTLGPRHLEVLEMVSLGWTAKRIAREIGISHRTVEIHKREGLKRLGCAGAAEVMSLFIERRLIEFYFPNELAEAAQVVESPS